MALGNRRKSREHTARSRLGNLFVRNKGVQYNDDPLGSSAAVSRGRAAGQALQQFNEEGGWSPHQHERNSDLVKSMALRQVVRSSRNSVFGSRGKLSISGQEIPISNMTEVIGSRESRSGNKEYVEVFYNTFDNNTVVERYEREEGGWWAPSWPPQADGGRIQSMVFPGGARMVKGPNGGAVIFSNDGRVKFEGGEGYEMREAFQRDCTEYGRVISAAGGDDVVVILQEDDQGRKTLTTMQVWSDDYDPKTEVGGAVHLRVHSVPIHPEFTSVYYEPDQFSRSNIKAVKGGDSISSMSLSDVENQSKAHDDINRSRRRDNAWKPPVLPYQQLDPNRRRL